MSNSRGFTLVELVVTLIVLGILAVTILPRFANRGDFDQRGAADKVLATLQFARKTAVAARRDVRVSLSGTAFVVTINSTDPDTAGAPAYNALQLPFQDGNCPSGSTGTVCLPSGVTLTPVPTISFPINFDPAGRTDQSGTITFSGGTLSTEINLVAVTGYVY